VSDAPGYDAQTALVVVDVQNDFADPDGSLYVTGGDDIIPAVNEQIAAARAGGATVVATQDWHPPSTPHFTTDGGTWPVHCVRATWGASPGSRPRWPRRRVQRRSVRLRQG
jgi:nicotinamidase/pyrazinamidase